MLRNPIDRIGDYNPQLFRELKGKLTKGKVILAVTISLVGQALLCWYFRMQLPFEYYYSSASTFDNRYCTGSPGYYEDGRKFECIKNFLGQIDLRWELWWFDLFFFLSIVSLFILLVGGTYLLAIDLIQEDQKGTLNFIRLSPIAAKDFFIGKMLGVPSLVYLVIGLTLPLHFWAGLQSHISPDLILAFYLLLGTSCAFFYSMALLFAFVTRRFYIPSALAIGSIITIFLIVTTLSILYVSGDYPYFGLLMLNPTVFLTHLSKATLIPPSTSGYFRGDYNITQILWYGKAIWSDAWGMIFTVFFNYVWWTYITFQGLKRLYHSPTSTLFSKINSYYISVSFVVIGLGFIKQSSEANNNLLNLFSFQFSLGFLFFILIGSISPHRQTILDWSRYSHHNSKSLLLDLLVGEKSPSVVAMIVNSVLVFSYLLIPFYLFLPSEYKLSGILGLICQLTTLCLLTLIAQFILMLPVKQQGILALFSVAMLSFLGLLTMGILRHFAQVKIFISPFAMPYNFMASLPSFALTLAFESLIFLSLGMMMKKQLSRFGESETKALLG